VTLNRISVLKTVRDSGPDRYGTCSAVAKRTADAIDGLRWKSQSGWNI
jgi:hypothetical protein